MPDVLLLYLVANEYWKMWMLHCIYQDSWTNNSNANLYY
jgi:hypothetical protein